MEKRSQEKVPNDNIEILLNEMVQRQGRHTKTMNDLVQAVNNLTNKQNQKEEKPETCSVVSMAIDTDAIKEVLKKGINDIKLIVAANTKSTTKKFQILLFPEQDAKLFYKIVFGRWFMWLAVMLFLSFAYKYIIHHDDNNKQLMIESFKNDRIIKAWDYLYSQKNKDFHKLMDSALKKVKAFSP